VNDFGRPGVVLDPMGELAITAGRVEDWLCFAGPPSYEAEVAVASGARAARAICCALADARESAPRLFSPDGHVELAALAVVWLPLHATLAAVHRALLALPDARPPSGTLQALELLNRCAVRSGSDDGVRLAAVARPGPESLRLDAAGYRAYERFARAVLTDPLDRAAALGVHSAHVAMDPQPGPELGL